MLAWFTLSKIVSFNSSKNPSLPKSYFFFANQLPECPLEKLLILEIVISFS